MSMDAIVLMPLVVGVGLLYWSSLISDDPENGHPILRLMLQFMFFPLIFMSIQFGVIDATLLYASDTVLVEQLAMMAYYFGWLLFAVGAYYCFVVFKGIWDMIARRKKEKDDEKYGDV